ncbi:MAG: hypothetical protein HY462_01020 [Parcubacteria group bacterium]|nr:hypothetical protein [Parcubacteria group bacterium]
MDIQDQNNFGEASTPAGKPWMIIIIAAALVVIAGSAAWWYVASREEAVALPEAQEEPAQSVGGLELSPDAATPSSTAAPLVVPEKVTTDAEIEALLKQLEADEAADDFDDAGAAGSSDSDLQSF